MLLSALALATSAYDAPVFRTPPRCATVRPSSDEALLPRCAAARMSSDDDAFFSGFWEKKKAMAEMQATMADDDMAAMPHWRENQTDFRAYVWDAVVVSHRTARALNESIAAPIIRLFPSVKISNYAHNYYSPPTRDDPPEITNWGCEPLLPLPTSCARRAREMSPLCCVSTPAT